MRKIILLLMAVLSIASLVGCGINDIPVYNEQVKSAWSEVENQYQRRADLIPNLVSVVRQAAKHEQDTFIKIANARKKLSRMTKGNLFDDTERMKKYQTLQSTIGTNINFMMRQLERYPVLQANQNFLQISSQLEGTENRIVIARREFIKSIENYNTAINTYPGKFYHQFLYSEYKLRDDSAYFHMSNKNMGNVPRVEF